ncbi:MAG: hypothetical protein HY023_16440, partial [Chloroflexi bacterium]|nr:hypothetical protein [Chloroflexota bacterium]
VEDVEMSLLLAARGLPVTFAPEARVFDPTPATDALAARQRARWLRGQWAVWKLYRREIARLLVRGPWAWSLVSSLLLKPKSLLLLAKALLCLAALTLWPIWPPVRVALGLLALSLLLDAAYYVIGLAFVENGSAFLLRLPLAPIFPVMWLRGASLALEAARTAKGWLRARQ